MPNPKTIEELLNMKPCPFEDGQLITNELSKKIHELGLLTLDLNEEAVKMSGNFGSTFYWKMPDGYYHLPPDKQLVLTRMHKPMKPPETVTLIDLEGNPIPLRENVPLHYFTGEYAHIVDFIWQFEETDYRIYIGNSTKVGEATKHYEQLLPLLLFLQDQLTFIRNGMWETLAIYQATLGQYWEVPIMQYDQLTIDYMNLHSVPHIVRRLETKMSIPYRINGEDFVDEQILKTTDDDRCILVTPSVYLNHYDVFSKLTPWKGE